MASEIVGDVVIAGGEPAALACATRLSSRGVRVLHLYPGPWGLTGASRDIGLAYPELGEPLVRLEASLGKELACEYHRWGKHGIELLSELAGRAVRRGSRLWLTRQEDEATLVASDALERQRLGDEVRLMSGGAASNYAPLATSVHQASFETHTLAFAPVSLCQALQQQLQTYPGYHAVELSSESWRRCRLESQGGGVRVSWPDGEAQGELAVVAAGLDSGPLLGRFSQVLVPLLGQAFRSPPLREKARSSVVGVTASWGFERYRFDDQRCLLGCGIDPSAGQAYREPVVLEAVAKRFWQRACSLFSDLAASGDDILRWATLFTTTCDGLPLLGPLPGEPRLQVAVGFSTSAWSRGLTAGDLLAEQLLEEGPAHPMLQRCSTRRFL